MNKPLLYLNEILSNYSDEGQHFTKSISNKIKKNYKTERDFVLDLTEEEIEFLNNILPNELNHAMQSEDFPRVQQLNEIYELLS